MAIDLDPDRSPCIGVCELDGATGLCKGCLRSGEEIGAWRDATCEQRREILRRIEARRARRGVDADDAGAGAGGCRGRPRGPLRAGAADPERPIGG